MTEKSTNKTTIQVQPPLIRPKFTNIGYGNSRYNSMLVTSDSNVLVTCGATLRKVDLKNNEILLNKQIGQSQIFNIIQNSDYIVVINFEGLVSFLTKQSYEIIRQFYTIGKQIRHSSISDKYLAVSCELNQDPNHKTYLQIYQIQDIINSEVINQSSHQIKVKPIVSHKGYFYYPQIIDQYITVIWYDDPNPKGRSRTQTVMHKKLPIKHTIMKALIKQINQKGIQQKCKIQFQGWILCAVRNSINKSIFYLHQSKRLTIFHYQLNKHIQTTLNAISVPHCIQSCWNGIIFASKSSQITYLYFQGQQIKQKPIKICSLGVGGNLSIKPINKNCLQTDFYLFNEHGLHLYCNQEKKTLSQSCFNITNCGLSQNQDASLFAVADFGGSLYIFTTQETNIYPFPITKVTIGIPIRSIVWCHFTNKIIIGCTGGALFVWDGQSQQAQFLNDYKCTVNILRSFKNYIIIGKSDGFIHIIDSISYLQIFHFQAHFPIDYQNEKDRELFGSMKNYAEIWSIATFQHQKENNFFIVTSSEDQSQKVFLMTLTNSGFSYQQLHHLVGHSLAVTSIDWKNMGNNLGPIYVSCSDDKIVRFRNPVNMFEIVHQLETSTIKQWHTLTYLALEPMGHRVAIGSQNGYLFIFDIISKKLLFGEKIHLGGIEGLDWKKKKLITCSSDLCISVITFD